MEVPASPPRRATTRSPTPLALSSSPNLPPQQFPSASAALTAHPIKRAHTSPPPSPDAFAGILRLPSEAPSAKGARAVRPLPTERENGLVKPMSSLTTDPAVVFSTHGQPFQLPAPTRTEEDPMKAEGGKTPASQTQVLLAMDRGLSAMFCSLASQHIDSEYNVLKRNLAQGIPASLPQPSAHSGMQPALLRTMSVPIVPQSPPRAPPVGGAVSFLPSATPPAPRAPQPTGVVAPADFTPVIDTKEEPLSLSTPSRASTPVVQRSSEGLLPGMIVVNGLAVKTSASHPINLSPIVPPEILSGLRRVMFENGPSTSSAPAPFYLPFTVSLLSYLRSQPAFPPVNADQRIGNFILSSCPGKKVRLTGPLPDKGGRSAISRDLSADLGRAKAEGVEVVVCCLNDQELEFLGVPWPEYEAAAVALELEVIRIPISEGYAPFSPAFLDAHLSRLVRDYTLRGKSVLCHCRGGVGRAGLIACCWLLKMGLVENLLAATEFEERMDVVRGVVELIRRRRSVKAIETAQQAFFLYEYVSFLAEGGAPCTAASLV